MLAGVLRASPSRVARFAVVLSTLALGGCGWGDYGRLDRDVRASWSALTATDTMSSDFVLRLVSAKHGSVAHSRAKLDELRASALALRELASPRHFNLSNTGAIERYSRVRQRMIAALRDIFETTGNRGSAQRAWRSRGIARESAAHLMRATAAAAAYNVAASKHNEALGRGRSPVSRALLYPGLRRFALLGAPQKRIGQLARPALKME